MLESMLDGYLIDRVWITFLAFILTFSFCIMVFSLYLIIQTGEIAWIAINLLLLIVVVAGVSFKDKSNEYARMCGPEFTREHVIQETEISEPITLTFTFVKCRYRTLYGQEYGPYVTEYVGSTATIY